MSFSKNDLEIIKSKISLRSELEKKHKLSQKGKDFWCCCPFHEEKTPSFKINDELGSFYCFGCNAKGDIFTIYTDLYNYSFIDAVKELAQRSGVKIDFDKKKTNKENKIEEILEISCQWFQKNLENSEAINCNKYLNKRKLKEEIIKQFRLGYSYNTKSSLYEFLKNKSFTDEELLSSNVVKLSNNKKIQDYFYKRLIFPIKNLQGKVVGFGGRSLDNTNPKYINSPESNFFQKRYLLYNLDLAKNTSRKKNNLLICEGYMDVISLFQNGIFSVVSPLGTSLTEDQLKLSWRYSTKPTVMFDGDSAGVRASYKVAVMSLPLISAQKFLQFISLPENFDPDSYINQFSFNNFLKFLKNPQSLIEFIFNQSSSSIKLNNADEKISYDKYLDDLIETIKDKKTQYFYKSELKTLFFNKLRYQNKNTNKLNLTSKKLNQNLNKKQNSSFIASAINNHNFRSQILKQLSYSDLFNEAEMKLINELQKDEYLNLEPLKLLKKIENTSFSNLVKECMSWQIYRLFPYSEPKFDPQTSFDEVLKSLNNLNTRLSNLKKINKSLDEFVKNTNSLNWSELQSINLEILDED